jgi:antitoxin ParD1/3/4
MNIYLGKHFEEFIRNQVESGRYANASEVVREALRWMEVDQIKLERLRAMLAEAEADFERGDFIEVTDVRAYIEGIRDRAIERAKARQEEQARAVS